MTDDAIGTHLRCSFCGKLGSEVAHMVCGPTTDIAICNECVALVGEIMRDKEGESPAEPGGDPSPSR